MFFDGTCLLRPDFCENEKVRSQVENALEQLEHAMEQLVLVLKAKIELRNHMLKIFECIGSSCKVEQ